MPILWDDEQQGSEVTPLPQIEVPMVEEQRTAVQPGGGAPALSPQQAMAAIPTGADEPALSGTITFDDANAPVGAGPSRPRMTLFPGGPEVPEVLEPVLGPVVDVAAGGNEFLAQGLGLAPEAVNALMETVGMDGFLDKQGDAVEAVANAMSKAGMATKKDAVSRLAADLGEELFKTTIITMATLALAPTMVAREGSSLFSNMLRKTGAELAARPGIAVGADLGASALGTVGQEMGGALGGLGGSLVGAAVGGVAATANPVRMVGDALLGAGRAAVPAVGASLAVTGDAAVTAGIGTGAAVANGLRNLWRSGSDAAARAGLPTTAVEPQVGLIGLDDARGFAQYAVKGDEERVDGLLRNAMTRYDQQATRNPVRAAESLRNGLRGAYKEAQTRAGKLWEAVPKKLPMTTGNLQRFGRAMLAEEGPAGARNVPGDHLAMIKRIGGKTGRTTIDQLRKVASAIGEDLRSPDTNDGRRKRLGDLQSEIYNEIARQHPDMKELQNATTYSKWLHDKFTRGPIGDVLERRGGATSTDFQKDAVPALKALVNKEYGGRDIAEVAMRLDRPGLLRASERYIKSQFQDAASQLDDPREAQRFLNSPQNKRFMAQFPAVDADMQVTGKALQEALDERNIVQNSALVKFAGEDPQTAIGKLFIGNNKVERARELSKRLGEDKDAHAGLRAGVIQHLWKAGGADPARIQDLMRSRDIMGMLGEVFSTSDLSRMQRIIAAGVSVQEGGQRLLPAAGQRAARLGASVLGSAFGGGTSRMIGQTSLIAQGAGANAARNIVDNIFRYTPPDELIRRAMADPQWERILMKRLPNNLTEAEDISKTIRRWIGVSPAMPDTEEEAQLPSFMGLGN